MPDKIPDNIEGRFYVSSRCINCSLCSEIAPDFFGTNLEQGYEFVRHQPVTKTELTLMAEMMELCPADAIQENY